MKRGDPFVLAAKVIAAQHPARQVLPVGMLSTCVGCGCDDLHACPSGCYWLRVDRERGEGVCSQCVEHVAAWDDMKCRLEQRRTNTARRSK